MYFFVQGSFCLGGGGGGYILFATLLVNCVGFSIKKYIVAKLNNRSAGSIERLITLAFNQTITSAYAPLFLLTVKRKRILPC